MKVIFMLANIKHLDLLSDFYACKYKTFGFIVLFSLHIEPPCIYNITLKDHQKKQDIDIRLGVTLLCEMILN